MIEFHVFALRTTLVWFDRPNVATSAGTIWDSGRCPVRRHIPLNAGRIEIPGGAVGINRAEDTEESVRTMAPDRMGEFMAAIMPLSPFKRKADS